MYAITDEDEDEEEEDDGVEYASAQIADEFEEEMEEEVFEVKIRGKTYFTADTENGEIYNITKDGDVGDEIGRFENGKAVFD